MQHLLINSELPLNTTNAYLNHKCLVSKGKYKPGSEYEKQLKLTIRNFYSDSGNKEGFTLLGGSGFSAILQCRGDSYGPKCRDCYATAVAAIDYDNNFCMSNAKTLGGDAHAFIMTWNILMDNLTTLAIRVDKDTKTPPLYAVGETRLKGDMMYGMVQCTKDIPDRACEECLVFNSIHFQDCFKDKRGARFMSRSCTFRFEFYPFIAKQVRSI
ncbi:Gnk2-homologous domain-containing protein [Hirschfeldia incana]|nr:Gnk2-homologous domain-containing protein [Hirschfeldia incana]